MKQVSAAGFYVLPRGQVNSLGILEDEVGSTGLELADEQHQRQIYREQYRKNIQVMHIQRQELGDRVQDNVYDQRDLRCAGRNTLGVEAYQHDREDRHGVEAEALLQEVIQTGRCVADERRYADGYDRKTGTNALAYAYQMCVACSLVEQRTVEVQRVKRYTAVQCRVKGRQDRTEQNRCDDAEQQFGTTVVIRDGYARSLFARPSPKKR